MKKIPNLNALHGMVENLARDHEEWATERRREFLETFAVVLDYVYPCLVTPIPVDKPARARSAGGDT